MLLVGSDNARVGFADGMRILRRGGRALDAVVATIRRVEANPRDHSVGLGGLPNIAGEVELVAREVRLYLREAQAVRALVIELRARALPAAERAANARSRALEGRSASVIDALAVDAQRVKVELRLLGLVRRYRTAVSELRRAVGGRLPSRGSK